jgi:hypothetical protein
MLALFDKNIKEPVPHTIFSVLPNSLMPLKIAMNKGFVIGTFLAVQTVHLRQAGAAWPGHHHQSRQENG